MDEGPFDRKQATDEQVKAMERVRDALHRAYTMVVDSAPHCRERSLALTKLEEAGMWTNKAITHGKEGGPILGPGDKSYG